MAGEGRVRRRIALVVAGAVVSILVVFFFAPLIVLPPIYAVNEPDFWPHWHFLVYRSASPSASFFGFGEVNYHVTFYTSFGAGNTTLNSRGFSLFTWNTSYAQQYLSFPYP